MKHLIICFFFLVNFSAQMKTERFEKFADTLFSSMQTFIGNVTHFKDPNDKIMLTFTNLRLINPILKKISYTYNETRPFYFTANNIIFTFVTDVYNSFSTYITGSMMLSMDLLMQITCDEIEFYNVDNMVATLSSLKCQNFFYSKSNYLGSLRTYDFLTKNTTADNIMKTFYNNLLSEQIESNLKRVNLISADIPILFDDMMQFLKTKNFDEHIEDYIFHNLTVNQILDLSFPIGKDNSITFYNMEFDFDINYLYKGENYSQAARIKTTVKISNKVFDFDLKHVDYDDCDSYFDEEICKFIFTKLYYKNFRKVFCDYYKEYQDSYEECLKKEE